MLRRFVCDALVWFEETVVLASVYCWRFTACAEDWVTAAIYLVSLILQHLFALV
jgi:hypothetical protein